MTDFYAKKLLTFENSWVGFAFRCNLVELGLSTLYCSFILNESVRIGWKNGN